MFDRDKWSEIYDSLSRHKLRTFLTALSVWWGIFMLVILIGAGNGLQNSFEKNFADEAINSLWIWQGQTSEPYNGLPAGRRIRFDNDDYDILRKEVEGIEYATGRYFMQGDYFITRKNKSLSFDVNCVHPDYIHFEKNIIKKGRYINQRDIDEARKICVIGTLVEEAFFEKDEEALGEHLNINGVDYQIVGVFTDTGSDREMRRIYIPVTTVQRIHEGEDRLHGLNVTVKAKTLAESKQMEQRIRSQLAVKHNFDPTDRQAIRIYNTIEDYNEFQTVFGFIKGFIWFVGIGSIIAGVIGVSNIMLIVVKDRTKEIGIRKAMGATPRSIINMILQEAIVLTSVAGYVGLLSGFAIIYGLKTFMEINNIEVEFFYNPEVNFGAVLSALLLLVICGTLAGLIPAMQAVRINPVIAMKGN